MFNFRKNQQKRRENFSTKQEIILDRGENSLYDECAQARNVIGMFNLTSRLPNPDLILRKTGKGISTLRELKSNYQVGACIESRKAGITSKKWRLNQQNSSDETFKFFQEIFEEINVQKLLEDILEAPLFGYAPIEISYKPKNGFIYPVKLVGKPQEWFYFSGEGEFFFNSKNNPILIQDENPKFLIPRHRADYLNPYGECLLSRCFWNVMFINGGMEFWMKFMEKYGTPWAIGKYDRSMSEEEQQQLFKMLKRMIQDAVATIPKDGSIELINAGDKSGSNDIYQTFITKCENNISKVILGQTLTTDVSSKGSYAAANIHQQVRSDLIMNDIRLVEATVNEFIKKVHKLNFNDKLFPAFELYDEAKIDESLAKRDNNVQNLGVKFTRSYIKRTYGYDDEDFILKDEQ